MGSGRDEVTGFRCECWQDDWHGAHPPHRRGLEDGPAEANRFAVAPDHVAGSFETVVQQCRRFWLIEKFGEAGKVAEKLGAFGLDGAASFSDPFRSPRSRRSVGVGRSRPVPQSFQTPTRPPCLGSGLRRQPPQRAYEDQLEGLPPGPTPPKQVPGIAAHGLCRGRCARSRAG